MDVLVAVRVAPDVRKALPRGRVMDVQHLVRADQVFHLLHGRADAFHALRDFHDLRRLARSRDQRRQALGDGGGKPRVEADNPQIIGLHSLHDGVDHILVVDDVARTAADKARANPVAVGRVVGALACLDIIERYPAGEQRDPLVQALLRREQQRQGGQVGGL